MSVARANRDVIVIGGSSGGVEVVREIVRGLPAGLPAAVFVVIHRGPQGPSLLADILDAAGPLRATVAVEGERFERGRVYVAPPDRHLLVGQDHVHVRRGPRENRTRPAVDPLFRSAAVSCSTRVVGVVISGMLDDGTAGLQAIKRCGGLAVVQDPADAAYPDMPRSAWAHVAVDHARPAAGLAGLLAELASASPRPAHVEAPENLRVEALIAAQELHRMPDQGRFGSLSPLTCPDCNGAMVEIRDDGLVRYRCHTGHAFTMDALQVSQGEIWEKTLYGAMRAQHEQALLSRHMAAEQRRRGNGRWAEDLEQRAAGYEEGAEIIRQLLAPGGARAGSEG
jgi:two-component system chemotaxis response regulator CheB